MCINRFIRFIKKEAHLMNQSDSQQSFSDISLILGSLVFGIILTLVPFSTEKIFPLITSYNN